MNDNIEEIVNKATDKQAKQYLIDILKRDETLALKFKTMVTKQVSLQDLEDYKKQINHIIYLYLNDDYCIHLEESYHFVDEIIIFLNDIVQLMIDSKCYDEAFELSAYLFRTIRSTEMEDYQDSKMKIFEKCIELWNEILLYADDKIVNKILQWVMNFLNQPHIRYYDECIENFFVDQFKDEKHLQMKLNYTKDKIARINNMDDYWDKYSMLEKWKTFCLIFMEQLDDLDNDITCYVKENYKYPLIRQQYVSYCLNKQKYDVIIQVLNDSLEMDDNKKYTILYRQQLKALYKALENDEAYKNQLWLLVTMDDPGNINDFRELKSLYTHQEWIEIREDIFLVISDSCSMDVLYKEEKLYDRLLEFLRESHDIYDLYKYEDILKKDYSKELLEIYKNKINKMALHSASRDTYKDWVIILRRMKKIEGGEEVVQQIVDDWHYKYDKRWALMEELEKI